MMLLVILPALMAVVVVGRDLAMPERANLLFYLPLDRDNGLVELSSGKGPAKCLQPKLLTDTKGPHGQYGTAFSIMNYAPLECYYSSNTWHSEFTLSFFVSTKAKDTGGLISLGGSEVFNVLYESPGSLVLAMGSQLIGTVSFSSNDDGWHYFAITSSNNQLKVMGRSGDILLSVPAVAHTQGAIINFMLGEAYKSGKAHFMKSTDALSCIMWFKTALTSSEVAQLPEICKKNAEAIVWPRPLDLYGYWPLDNGKLDDLGMHLRHGSLGHSGGKAVGPFGKHDTAMIAGPTNYVFNFHSNLVIASNNKFTVLLHFAKGSSNKNGCIFEFSDRFGTDKAFQFCYSGSSFIDAYANGELVGRYNMVQQKGAWTFIGFVFDGTSLIVYSKHGVVANAQQPHVLAANTFNNNGIKLGFSTRMNQTLMDGDRVACLMVYETALAAIEVKHARDSCRVVLGSAPCGSPKLNFPRPPELTSDITTVPQPGQFPWVASLRHQGSHVCSATIIDQFWLLTSARCFLSSADVTKYSVIVAEYDLNTDEKNSKQHTIEKIVIQKSSAVAEGEYALIAVTDPIDFNNDWVNDACFVSEDIKSDLKSGARQIVHGWGVNGRSPLTQSSLPRYFSGSILTDKQCQRPWGKSSYIGGNTNYCFFSLTTDKDVPCDGDDGAPLLGQAKENMEFGIGERLVQLGMFYKRDANCTATMPGLFVGLDEPMFGWVVENIACAVPGVTHPSTCKQI